MESSISSEQKISTKERIFLAAVDLFLERGFFETSVRELAQRSGIRVSSLYNHYPGKEAILDDILEYFKAQVEKAMIPDDKMEAFVDSMPPDILLTRGFAKIIQSITPSVMDKIYHIIVIEVYRNPKVRHFYEAYNEQNIKAVRKLFMIMQDKKLIREMDPVFLADAYMAMINFYSNRLFLYKADYEDSRKFEEEIEQRLLQFVDLFKY